MKKIEIFVLLLIPILFLLILGKYYFPETLQEASEETKNEVIMTTNYYNYRTELYLDKEQYPTYSERNERAQSIPVLVYHGISNQPYKEDTTLNNFKEQLFRLKKEGYQTITLQDFYDFVEGKKELPEKSFLLTFDDGIKSSYYNVDPILKALNYSAVIFIISKYSVNETHNSVYYLNYNEIKEMKNTGRWELQAHAKDSHNLIPIDSSGNLGRFFSSKMWLADQVRLETNEEYIERVNTEFTSLNEDLTEKLDQNIYAFAFPFGDMGEASLNFPEAREMLANEAVKHYKLIFHQHWPSKGFSGNYPGEEIFVRRITVYSHWNDQELMWVLEKAEDKSTPFYDDFEFNTGWIKVAGDVIVGNSSLVMKTSNITHDGSVFLDGSALFKDYVFKISMKELNVSELSLRARYKNEYNYLSCDFNNKKIRIIERIDGQRRELAFINSPNILGGSNKIAAIRVKNNSVGCLFDNKELITTRFNEDLINGGVSIRISESSEKEGVLTLNEVNIENA